jgi:tRNA(Arg) A34 adenosine deaminase TadA
MAPMARPVAIRASDAGSRHRLRRQDEGRRHRLQADGLVAAIAAGKEVQRDLQGARIDRAAVEERRIERNRRSSQRFGRRLRSYSVADGQFENRRDRDRVGIREGDEDRAAVVVIRAGLTRAVQLHPDDPVRRSLRERDGIEERAAQRAAFRPGHRQAGDVADQFERDREFADQAGSPEDEDHVAEGAATRKGPAAERRQRIAADHDIGARRRHCAGHGRRQHRTEEKSSFHPAPSFQVGFRLAPSGRRMENATPAGRKSFGFPADRRRGRWRLAPARGPARIAAMRDVRPDMTSSRARPEATRRLMLGGAAAAALGGMAAAHATEAMVSKPERSWYEAAERMRLLALSWGDQSYGAVLVLDDLLVGEGPSRVVKNDDVDAHAEREAIRDAQRRLGRADLAGSVLYSTSRPCRLCETAAHAAGVARMIFGPALTDAGAPRF